MSDLSSAYTIDELYEIAYRGSYTDSERQLAKELLAYREAQSEPIGIIRQVCGNKTLVWANDAPEGTVLYTAPQLPAVPGNIIGYVSGYTREDLALGSSGQIWSTPDGLYNAAAVYAAPQLPAVLDKMTHEQRDILIKTAQVMFDREPTSDYSANIREVARIALASLNPDEPTDDERIMAIEGIIPAVDNVNSPVIPDGWALVPIEPTDDMCFAPDVRVGNQSWDGGQEWANMHECKDIYKAMIAAAPKPPATENQ